MRFISKSSNLFIVLKPGMTAQPLTGTPAVPTVSVRFKEGIADVPDGQLTEMMLRHPGFDQDYISAESVSNIDPYAYQRQENEPTHVVTEMKFGSPVGRSVQGGRTPLPPERAKMVQDRAVNMAKEMLPTMLESALQGLVKAHEGNKGAAVKPKGKRGPKPKVRPAAWAQPAEASAPSTPSAENPALQQEVV